MGARAELAIVEKEVALGIRVKVGRNSRLRRGKTAPFDAICEGGGRESQSRIKPKWAQVKKKDKLS